MKYLCILGATGSIGTQTLDVVRHESHDFKVFAVSANTDYEKMEKIINEFHPLYAVMTDKNAYKKLKEYIRLNSIKINIMYGMDGLNEIVSIPEINIVVTSVVGMIGLVPTINAIKNGKDIALANKETLVAGGSIVMDEARKNNVKILPVDSEHGAISQCLKTGGEISKLLITASGGPFREKNLEELKNVTLKDALKHPTWSMGPKITIDSATLMNKGLEVIEAHFLFNVPYDKIEVVVHPESIIHSMVEFIDGSVIAQMASHDMRLPIQYALNYGKRKNTIIPKLDFKKISSFTFQQPNIANFKCLKLAYEAGKLEGNYTAVLNSANEAAVQLFIHNKIGFLDISYIVEECINKFGTQKSCELETIIEYDKKVKEYINNKY